MSKKPTRYVSGRGAQTNPKNRFQKNAYSQDDPDGIDEFEPLERKTQYIEVFPKTIVNKVTSPDVGMDYSLNPYQGCEHGCTYCYARPTHEYWGYGAGVDFESVILVKKNAPELLERTFMKKTWEVKPIVLSGNTDCYQPAERKFRITRSLLEVFLKFRHPVGIITKNALMSRDLDVVEQLAELNLIAVNISITSLDEELRRKLEPRTASGKKKLELVRSLSDMNIPVNVMIAPVIPALNDHEVFSIVQAANEYGATSVYSHVVRLMGPNEGIFEEWLRRNFPDRMEKVLNQLKQIHGGRVGSSNFGERMRGGGALALNLRRQFEVAKAKFFTPKEKSPLRTDLFERPNSDGQLKLF